MKHRGAPSGLSDEDQAIAEAHAALNAALATLPDAESGGGAAVYMQVLAAKDWRELDAPWSGMSMGKYDGRRLVIDAVHKAPSMTDGPLDYYIVAHGAAAETGDEATFLTSSLNAVSQLVTAYTHRWLPLTVIPRIAKRPTDRGRYPQWLQILDGPADPPAGGA